MIGHAFDEVEVVLDQEEAPALHRLQLEDHLDEAGDLLVLQAADRLVEQQDLGPAHQRADQLDPAPETERQHVDGDVGHGAHPEVPHEPLGPVLHLLGVAVPRLEVLPHGEHIGQLGELEGAAQAGPGPGVGRERHEARQGVDQRGLAGAVGAHDRHPLAGADPHVDEVDGPHAAERHADALAHEGQRRAVDDGDLGRFERHAGGAHHLLDLPGGGVAPEPGHEGGLGPGRQQRQQQDPAREQVGVDAVRLEQVGDHGEAGGHQPHGRDRAHPRSQRDGQEDHRPDDPELDDRRRGAVDEGGQAAGDPDHAARQGEHHDLVDRPAEADGVGALGLVAGQHPQRDEPGLLDVPDDAAHHQAGDTGDEVDGPVGVEPPAQVGLGDPPPPGAAGELADGEDRLLDADLDDQRHHREVQPRHRQGAEPGQRGDRRDRADGHRRPPGPVAQAPVLGHEGEQVGGQPGEGGGVEGQLPEGGHRQVHGQPDEAHPHRRAADVEEVVRQEQEPAEAEGEHPHRQDEPGGGTRGPLGVGRRAHQRIIGSGRER